MLEDLIISVKDKNYSQASMKSVHLKVALKLMMHEYDSWKNFPVILHWLRQYIKICSTISF